jgi:HEAT repeat protein
MPVRKPGKAIDMKRLFPGLVLVVALALTVCAKNADDDTNHRQRTTGEVFRRRVDVVVRLLGSRDPRVRDSAILGLVKVGQPAVRPLINALEDETWRGTRYAAESLRRIAILKRATTRPTTDEVTQKAQHKVALKAKHDATQIENTHIHKSAW